MKKSTGDEIAPQNIAPLQGVRMLRSRILVISVLGSLSVSLAGSGNAAPGPVPPWHDGAPLNASFAAGPLANLPREFSATDGAAGDSFGYSVALQGRTAVVGAPGATVGSNQAQGAVYVFRFAGGTWTEMARLTADDGAAFDDFGNGVGFDGGTIIVGAPDAAVNGNAGQGAAYIFTLSDGVWTQAQKLVAADGAFGNEFGDAVAIQGDTALIGAIQLLHGNGAAYIFDNAAGTWSQTQKLIAKEGSTTFGDAVALDGSNALIGAQQTSVDGFFDQGAAFVFTNENGTWTEAAILLANDGTMFDSLGSSVALEGATALVGAPGTEIDGSQIGAAYVFNESGGKWQQTQRVTASNARAGDSFGSSVALDGAIALIGADQFASNGPGKAYLFDNSTGIWTQKRELGALNRASNDEFGFASAFDRTDARFLIGAWGANINGNDGQGAVYFGQVPPGS